MKLAGAMLIIRGGKALLYRALIQFEHAKAIDQGERGFAWELEKPYWPWIALAGLGAGLILGSSHLGKLPKTDSGSKDLSMPAMGLLLILGAGEIFSGIGQFPATGFPELRIFSNRTDGIAAVVLGMTLLCFAPCISRSFRSVSISDLYSGGLRFTAAAAGLWRAASLAANGLDRLFTPSPGEGLRIDQQSLVFSSFSVGVFSCLLVISVMVGMSNVGWPRVSKNQPEGDFIAPIVSYTALSAGLTLYWTSLDPISLAVLTTLALLIGTSPRLIANLIRKLLHRFKPMPGTGEIE